MIRRRSAAAAGAAAARSRRAPGASHGAPLERRPRDRFDLRNFAFGGPAAVITSLGLIIGLDAATATNATVAGSLLIIGIADNLCDSLGVHIYQESERLPSRQALRTTVANFAARFSLTLTFVALVLTLSRHTAIVASAVWGLLLLAGLSTLLARSRGVAVWPEIGKHCFVALAVIAISKAIGTSIAAIAVSP